MKTAASSRPALDPPAPSPVPAHAPWRPMRKVWMVLAWLPGLALLCGLVWLVVTHFAEEQQLALLLRRARPSWLLAATLLQVLTYLSVGEAWRIPLAAAGHRPSRWRLARLSVLKLTLDQAVPTGGLSGTILMVRRLIRFDIPRDVVGATMLIVLVGYYLAYAVAVIIALAILAEYRKLNPILATVATTFAVLAAFLPPLFVWLGQVTPRRFPERLKRLPWSRDLFAATALVSPSLLARKRLYLGTAAGSFVTMLLDAATLATTLAAVGATPSLPACFAALVMASVAATIGLMPGGLGTFESASVGVLTLTGTDAATALCATLLLRGFTFWLPMIPGVLLLGEEDRRNPASTTIT